MTTLAPASASASAQASPIPCPAPVTTAVLPPSLNFSRYIFCFLSKACPGEVRSGSQRRTVVRRQGHAPTLESTAFPAPSRPDRLAAVIEAMQALRIRGEPYRVACRQTEFADAAHGERSDRPGVDIEK